MSKIKKLSIISFVLAFTLVPISFSLLIEHSRAEDVEIIDSDQEWTTSRLIENNVIINSGVTLFVKKGVTLTFSGGNINVKGNLVLSGTLESPVKFKKADNAQEYYSTTVESGGKLIMRNADVSGAGASIHMLQNNSILNTANAYFLGGIHMSGGSLDAQGCNFHDNIVAIFINSDSAGKVIVNRTKFNNNAQLDVAFGNYSGDKTVNFKYNWWGNADGPSKTCYEGNDCYYDKLDGNIDSSDWLTKESFHDPVIIIPGILGSWKWTNGGEWKIDPILRIYDSLIETFEKNGYTKDKDLFTFPYQWRDSNVNNAKLLQDKISEIKQKNNWPKVDLVAHSMGGLLAREYIESDYYKNDVDQLVTLGTPHNGAPEDYLMWDGGKIATSKIDLVNILIEKIFKQEAKENGYDSIFDYIHNLPMKSVSELLPIYNYLYDIALDRMRSYLNKEHYPENNFLEKLNSPSNLNKLSNVEFINIVGELDDNKTNNEIKVGKPSLDDDSIWAHGKPENFDALTGDHGLNYGNGDGTVPLESTILTLPLKVGVRNVADESVILVSSHAELPADGASIVFEALTGQLPSKNMPSSFVNNLFVIFVFSPIDVQIISPSGKIVGKDFIKNKIINEIDGAYYTGYDNIDNEFITIPNPEDGEYKILTQGTGTGEYKIEATKIIQSKDDSLDAKESTVTIMGTTEPQKQDELKILVTENAVTAEKDKDVVAPEIKIISPENKSYLNNQILKIDYSVVDNISKLENIQVEIFYDGKLLGSREIDLSLQSLGAHALSISATDEAGNKVEKKINFSYLTNIEAIAGNINHYTKIKLITDAKTQKFLQMNVREIDYVLDVITKLNCKNNRILKINQVVIRLLNKQIDGLIGFIQGRLAKTIISPAKESLIQSLNSVKI